MNIPYCCPACKTNRTRFNIIDQEAHYIKKDPNTGNVVEEVTQEQLDPFHVPYKGPNIRVQCGVCGLIEDEMTFVKTAENRRN
ncbi:DNA alkylation repair protein [Bacillus carboniphilus]|uniref:DNA alkylation repair protein n=1 Tax=Bacillus carboniphilus TaxID=86663 RepID=A0ABY9JV79_9BACI|nr:DNA alkylation repair protein [Bacillus carboniphilus]WLR43312.1 DNA alkylation repair protein [Bacillus carboniphilus]